MADTNSNPAARILPHLEGRKNNKLSGNGITESVKSSNLHQKGRIIWYSSLKNDFKR
jgi:hypothetical protein